MEFIDKIEEFSKCNKEVEIYLDMDGTVVECIFDLEESFAKKGGYLKKVPIKPVIDKIETIKKLYPNIKIKILSFSRNNQMVKEKNKWLDINMPYINKENRIFLIEEDYKFNKKDINKEKGKYIKANIKENKIIVLIDDDVRILNETQKMLKNQVIPMHVTSVLI